MHQLVNKQNFDRTAVKFHIVKNYIEYNTNWSTLNEIVLVYCEEAHKYSPWAISKYFNVKLSYFDWTCTVVYCNI